MKLSHRYYMLFGLLLLLSQVGFGQIKKQAQVGFRFLENPVSAAALGRGGYGVTNLHSAAAVFWNPAGLGWIESRVDAGIDYYRGFADINQTSAAVAMRGTYGAVALSAIFMDYGNLYGTRLPLPGEDATKGYVDTGTFTIHANAIGIGYGRAVSDRFSFGLHFKLAQQDFGRAYLAHDDSTLTKKKYMLTVPTFDFGASYDFKVHGITFGAAVMNVSPQVMYEEESFPLPFAMKFGSSIDPFSVLGIELASQELLLGIETRHGRDFGEKVHVGAEYGLYDTFFARAGYMGNYSDKGVTFGIGLNYQGFIFDYALQDYGVLGIIHLLTFGYRTGN
jgi:hypothetical protein